MKKQASNGTATSGSAVEKLQEITGYLSIGYPFGLTASILFARHSEMEGPNYDAQMVDLILGFSHFEMEGYLLVMLRWWV